MSHRTTYIDCFNTLLSLIQEVIHEAILSEKELNQDRPNSKRLQM